MQSNDKVFFTMDLLRSPSNSSEVQVSPAPKTTDNCVDCDEELNITPPDQSNIVIPQNLIFVRKPVKEEDVEIEIDEYAVETESSGVSETTQSEDDDEFVYKEPPKLAPVDDALVFIRKPKQVEEEVIEFDDADILVEDEPVEVVKVEEAKVVEPSTVVSVDETPIESVKDVVEEDSYIADSLAFLGVDEEEDDYDLLGFEDLDDNSDYSEIDYYEENINEVIDDVIEETDEKNIINNDVIDSDIDGEILYKSEDTKYNENKYRSDNIIRDYEEDNKYNYPLLYLTSEKVELFRVQALTGMLDKRSFIDTDELYYHVYVEVDGSVVYLGKLLSKLLRTILNNQTFNTFNKKVFLNKDTSYEGDMLYALSEIDISLLS